MSVAISCNLSYLCPPYPHTCLHIFAYTYTYGYVYLYSYVFSYICKYIFILYYDKLIHVHPHLCLLFSVYEYKTVFLPRFVVLAYSIFYVYCIMKHLLYLYFGIIFTYTGISPREFLIFEPF